MTRSTICLLNRGTSWTPTGRQVAPGLLPRQERLSGRTAFLGRPDGLGSPSYETTSCRTAFLVASCDGRGVVQWGICFSPKDHQLIISFGWCELVESQR